MYADKNVPWSFDKCIGWVGNFSADELEMRDESLRKWSTISSLHFSERSTIDCGGQHMETKSPEKKPPQR